MDVLVHIAVKNFKGGGVERTTTPSWDFAILDSSEFVILLPQIGLKDLGGRQEPENGGVSWRETASSKMSADSLCDWAYFYLLSCSVSFYDICYSLVVTTEVLLHCSFLQEEIREALVDLGFQRVANGFGKLAGRGDDGAACSSPGADSLVVTRQPSAPSYEG